MRKFFLLFAVLPPLDLFLLFKLGKAYGAGLAFGFSVLAFVAGAYLARRLGLRVLHDWQGALASGKPPSEGVAGGALALLGCVLLMIPGLVSDALGIALLVPGVRRIAAQSMNRRLRQAIERGAIHVAPGPRGPFGVDMSPPQRRVIDVEAEVVDSNDEPPKQLGS